MRQERKKKVVSTDVLVGEVEATVTGHERRQLLPVLDELHPHALPDSGVRLFRLDTAEIPGKEGRNRRR